MTLIRINFPAPDGDYLDATVTFTHQHQVPGRPVTEGASVISGAPIRVEVTGSETTVDLRPTQAGSWYRVAGTVDDGYRFTEHIQVLATLEDQTVDYGSLVRADPKAGGLPYTPDPAWWRVADELLTLGGIPGKSAKEVIEDAYNLDLTIGEFEARIRGAKGDKGTPGRDGKTYLDYFRDAIDNPQATDEDYHEWIRGRTALEQWAVYVGEDPAEAEVSDMLEWLRVDAFKLWKQHQGRPNATLGDFFDYFKGEKGDPSYVAGPEGPQGKSAYQSVVDSGYEGSEEDFADALLGEELEWEECDPQNGWSHSTTQPLMALMLDGILHISGRLLGGGDPSGTIAHLPDGMGPAGTVQWFTVQAISGAIRGIAYDDGTLRIHNGDQSNVGSQLAFDASMPANGTVRPRIPGQKGDKGDPGTTAAEFARDAGWGGTDAQFASRMSSMAHIGDEDWDRFMATTELSQGPRGRSAYDVVRDSGYTGTEEDFADSLLGRTGEWVECQLLNGWGPSAAETLYSKVEDGVVHLSGRIANGNTALQPIAQLPEGHEPARLGYRAAYTSDHEVRLIIIDTGGEIRLWSSSTGSSSQFMYFDATFPARVRHSRPRIPGPAGKSVAELLQDDGLDLPAAEITRRLRVLVEGVE